MKKLLLFTQLLFVFQLFGQQSKQNITLLSEANFNKMVGSIGHENLQKHDYFLIYKNESKIKVVEGLPAVGLKNNTNFDIFVIIRTENLDDLKFTVDNKQINFIDGNDSKLNCNNLKVTNGSEIILELK